ncbi:MAG: lipoyl synthase [Thermodesulfobacteriota bacterium]
MSVAGPRPKWLRRRLPPVGRNATVRAAVQAGGLHTVCAEAQCPNQMECFGRGTATFLLLGPTCTRRCTFCAVDKSVVRPADPAEPARIAHAVSQLALDFCVLTMVTRDDLPDGGADHIVETVAAIRNKRPGLGIEVLISDLSGDWSALRRVLEARPEVLNHNVETVPRLYPRVRPQADYGRSLELLARASSHTPPLVTKSGVMLGLGETREELLATLQDIRGAGCSLLTLGQYLAPSERHHPVIRYVPPEEFAEYESLALGMGFSGVASSPFVRSSYQAGRLYQEARARMQTS